MDAPTIVELTDLRLERAGTRVFTTLEGDNPSGSLKDRMVGGELSELLAAGALAPGDRVSEVSAGSTARSLAWYGRELELRVDLFVPDTLPEEETDGYAALGATVHRGNRETGYALYEDFCAREHPHRLDQLSDASLSRHYRALGSAVNAKIGPVDAVIGAVGTGHSLLGTAAGMTPRPLVVTAEPAEPFAIPGIRNIELERYGPQDACTPDLFDLRLVLSDEERAAFVDGVVRTDHGDVVGGASLGLVLAAARRLLAVRSVTRLFLIGATARRR